MTSIVNTLPEDKWRSFVDQHPAGNIFHTPEMFQVFSCTRNHYPEIWAAVDHDNRVLALMPIVKLSVLPGSTNRLTTRSIVYGGILSEESEAGSSAVIDLLSEYKRQTGSRVLFTEIRNISPAGHFQPALIQAGFNYEDHLNYLVDLNRASQEVFLDIGNRTRKNIRRAMRHGKVSIEQVDCEAQIKLIYNLLQKTFQAAMIPLADISLFEASAEILLPKGMIRFTAATVEGNMAAVSVELLYHRVMYGWYGGTDRTYSAYVPNEVLTWFLLNWGIENGYALYDFGGAGKPDQEYGVRHFKAKFGGELVCYGRNTWIPSAFNLGLSKVGYSILRRILFQKMPNHGKVDFG